MVSAFSIASASRLDLYGKRPANMIVLAVPNRAIWERGVGRARRSAEASQQTGIHTGKAAGNGQQATSQVSGEGRGCSADVVRWMSGPAPSLMCQRPCTAKGTM